jgi:chorismate mutase
MSPTIQKTNLENYRKDLLALNHEFFSFLEKRRTLCLKIQELKNSTSHFSAYDPEREKEVFHHFINDIRHLSLSELLAFSLIMEEQAQALSPGSYPRWSKKIHLKMENSSFEIFYLMNPLLLKAKNEALFEKLKLSAEFTFLKDFSFS